MSKRYDRFGRIWIVGRASRTRLKWRRRALQLASVNGQNYLYPCSLVRVSVCISIGSWQSNWIRLYGSATPQDYANFALVSDYWLTESVAVTLHRSYVLSGRITLNMSPSPSSPADHSSGRTP